ncbi:MAG TPA: hypothetical protein VER17_12160 [Tepidisphaeraceae bacterium]|nr:hypothetical protein [Tepidisphaeraceae bacterium]
MKSLDQKLANIHADPSGARDFILADAKDADMAAGLAAPGKDVRTGKLRSLADYRDQMREITRQGLIDIMLMSCSTSDQLTIRERLFDASAVTPACRANDTTDIHLQAGGVYPKHPSRPFRSCTIDQIQSGRVDPSEYQRQLGANLGLYSITPNNDLDADYQTLAAYKAFRLEAEAKGFRHFLEVFDPNACGGACPHDLGRFINDWIVRTLAGVPSAGRPIFLKIAYHGPGAMEALVTYDPHLVVGILGGSSGTTHDAFKLLEDARAHGARAALYGRKINSSEHQLTFVRYLHAIANGKIRADEACRAYHGELQKLQITPYRSLKDDLELTTTATSYAGSGTRVSPAGAGAVGAAKEPPRGDAGASPMTHGAAKARESAPATTGARAQAAVRSAVIAKPAAAKASPSPSSSAATSSPAAASSPAASSPATSSPAASSPAASSPSPARSSGGEPDYRNMTSAQKVALARKRIQDDLARASAAAGGGNGR